MAPVEIYRDLSVLPVAVLGSHITLASVLTLLVARTIFRSYLALPPSQGSRIRQPSRKSHVILFAGLAFISLVLASFWGYSFASLSYRVWATERGIELPDSFLGDKGALRGGQHPGRLQLVRWLNDTNYYQDVFEIVAEKARRFWWGQQIDLATVSWSLLLAIEGRRRNIPHLWVYLLLSQLVSLSFAQNLFFLTLILTPVPLPDNVRDLTKTPLTQGSSTFSRLKNKLILSKDANWGPYPILYIIPLALTSLGIFLLPLASNTPDFITIAIAARFVTYTPLILPYVVPDTWGTVHTHPHDAHSAYTSLFRIISIVSFVLYGKSTVLALFFNTPDSSYHRHSILYPFKTEHRSAVERGSTAVSKVLGALAEHPAVAAVGWDVLLSGLSVSLWAAIRGLDVQNILRAVGLSYSPRPRALKSQPRKPATEKANSTAQTPARRRGGRPKKVETPDDDDSWLPTPSPTKRRSRSKKALEAEADKQYQPNEVVTIEGDEVAETDWEIGALAWGLIAAFGLGSGSAGVFGAETTAR